MPVSPFKTLSKKRTVNIQWLPNDLSAFYSLHESSYNPRQPLTPDQWSISIAPLKHLKQVNFKDLNNLGMLDHKNHWPDFSGIRIATGSFFDDIIYTLHSSYAPSGSIIAFGQDIPGPAGSSQNQDAEVPALILAEDFHSWLTRLEQDKWEEHGLTGFSNLPPARTKLLRKYFLKLNPNIEWANEGQS